MTITTAALATAAALALASAAHAAIVVQYDNDAPVDDQYDTGDDIFANPAGLVASDLDNDGFADDVTGSQPASSTDRFNENSTFYNPADVPGYTGPDIYGGIRAQALNATTVSFDDKTLGDFNVRVQGNTTNNKRLHLAVFLPTTAATELDADSFIGFSSSATGTPDGLLLLESLTARFLIRTTGDNFFVSDATIADTADGRVLNGTELATATFASYSPETDINFDQASAAFTVTTADLNALGITGYGVYAENDTFGTARSRLSFSEFYADAEFKVIPEPATFAIMGISGLLLLPRRKRA